MRALRRPTRCALTRAARSQPRARPSQMQQQVARGASTHHRPIWFTISTGPHPGCTLRWRLTVKRGHEHLLEHGRKLPRLRSDTKRDEMFLEKCDGPD